jgi:hypothetical protein
VYLNIVADSEKCQLHRRNYCSDPRCVFEEGATKQIPKLRGSPADNLWRPRRSVTHTTNEDATPEVRPVLMRTCDGCGTKFTPKRRSDAVTCGPRCRKSRERRLKGAA